ncbi:tRNA N(3)-methylcytidine methyltransferase METTL2-like isoform X2 [Actinia tenebrosa]|uniref:tRNA N(3)-methylcytidine methyltransferase n=1 Tax=Actinia tenebrosa TaxID=6105 RepID=A0A6P8HAG4_ACTTE|nr:tRNA N(3)-methylcytidine methyltransferase METTL2-like isoform X2 [Actinia tenebrosa]
MADEVEGKRPQFGSRLLTDPSKVFEHNAWDNVEWDSEQEQQALKKITENSAVKIETEMREKYETEASNFWDEFYNQHQNRFFKDRHWLFTEFPELGAGTNQDTKDSESNTNTPSSLLDKSETVSKDTQAQTEDSAVSQQKDRLLREKNYSKKKCVLEVGCGVGNTIFPILEANNDPNLFVYGCDFSKTAVDLVKEHQDYNPDRCHAFVCDVTQEDFVYPFPDGSLDIILLIFVLSAVHPDKMQTVISRLAKLLKPGGVILFRDYGRYDLAQLRFKKGRCLEDNFYVRGDGTRVYFFEQDDLSRMFSSAGLVEEQNHVDRRLQVNRGRQLRMYRIWIQCKYRKPKEMAETD